MVKATYKVIGVMSGTSLDGVDVAYVSFAYTDQWQFKILNATTYPYSETWRNTLSELTYLHTSELLQTDVAYTNYLATLINRFITEYHITDVDFIASHGHTAWHKPKEAITYQLGNLSSLANTLGRKVICDFRVDDVNLGGQGAPLVPIGDKLLFNDYDYCLNLGGFANVSYKGEDQRIAYDICPVNTVLNHYASLLDMPYDKDGEIAKSGSLYRPLLHELNALVFYKKLPPKSLGIEWVKDVLQPLLSWFQLSEEDTLRTFTEHVAIQIAKHLHLEYKKVLVTGGGAYNTYLMARIAHYTDYDIQLPEHNIIDFKEALIFAFLGVLKDRNEVNVLASVTGASKDHCSGKILLPQK